MPEKITKKIDDLETKDSIIGTSKKLLSKLKENVNEKLSWEDVNKRFHEISNKIADYWESTFDKGRLEYKTFWKDGKQMDVKLNTSLTDSDWMSIEIKKENVATTYSLYPNFITFHIIVWI